VLIETPSNPLMRVVDIASLAALAHAEGAKVVVDNTFLSPALRRPILLGADVVVHSTTKYLNGHSDVVGGAVISADAADAKILSDWANVVGVGRAPFDSYLTLRGLRTLFPRVEQQQRSGRGHLPARSCRHKGRPLSGPAQPSWPPHRPAPAGWRNVSTLTASPSMTAISTYGTGHSTSCSRTAASATRQTTKTATAQPIHPAVVRLRACGPVGRKALP
jgi:hypothetical protein